MSDRTTQTQRKYFLYHIIKTIRTLPFRLLWTNYCGLFSFIQAYRFQYGSKCNKMRGKDTKDQNGQRWMYILFAMRVCDKHFITAHNIIVVCLSLSLYLSLFHSLSLSLSPYLPLYFSLSLSSRLRLL